MVGDARRRTLLRACIATACLAATSASQVRAQSAALDQQNFVYARPLELHWLNDFQVMATGLALSFAPTLRGGLAQPDMSFVRAGGVNGFDRNVIGNSSHTAKSLSDVLLYSSAALPQIALAAESLLFGEPIAGHRWTKSAFIMGETLVVTAMVTNLTKFMVRRPRPYVYDPDTSLQARQKQDATLSFFSGHTSVSFAMATSYSYLFSMRHPESPWRLPVWLGTHSVATAAGVARGLAGKHFWTDIMVGAGVGMFTGWLVPYMHSEGNIFSRLPLKGMRMLPSFPEGGFGLQLLAFTS